MANWFEKVVLLSTAVVLLDYIPQGRRVCSIYGVVGEYQSEVYQVEEGGLACECLMDRLRVVVDLGCGGRWVWFEVWSDLDSFIDEAA